MYWFLLLKCTKMEFPSFKSREEITKKDVIAFIVLLLFLAFWTWLTFYSGYLF